MGRVTKRKRKTPLPYTDLGSATAEHDSSLQEYYVDNPFLTAAEKLDDRTVFFLGGKGTGKSAILEMVQKRIVGPKLIYLGSEDIGLGMLSNAELFGQLGTIDLGIIYRAIWDYLILVSILREEFGTTKPPWWKFKVPQEERKVFDILEKAGELRGEGSTLGSVFANILKKLNLSMTAIASDGSSYSATLGLGDGIERDIGSLMTELGFMKYINKLRKELPDKCKHSRFYVLIDDLDEGWRNTPPQRECLNGLIRSLVKLQHLDNVKFVVALRKTIFDQLDVDDPDKIRDYLTELTWIRGMLKEIVMKRLMKGLGRKEEDIVTNVLPERVSGQAPFGYMFSRLPQHPRAHIQFIQHALKLASDDGQSFLRADDFVKAYHYMSTCYADDIAFEYKTIYGGLRKVIDQMVGCPKIMSQNQVRELVFTIFEWSIDQEKDPALMWIRELGADPSEENCDIFCKHLIDTGLLGFKRSRKENATFFPPNLPKRFSSKVYFQISPYLEGYLLTA